MILVGVGNLGTALLQYNFSKNNNTVITHAFDVDEKKIGTKVGEVPVYNWDKLEEIGLQNVSIAVLTVPASQAQKVLTASLKRELKGF